MSSTLRSHFWCRTEGLCCAPVSIGDHSNEKNNPEYIVDEEKCIVESIETFCIQTGICNYQSNILMNAGVDMFKESCRRAICDDALAGSAKHGSICSKTNSRCLLSQNILTNKGFIVIQQLFVDLLSIYYQ